MAQTEAGSKGGRSGVRAWMVALVVVAVAVAFGTGWYMGDKAQADRRGACESALLDNQEARQTSQNPGFEEWQADFRECTGNTPAEESRERGLIP